MRVAARVTIISRRIVALSCTAGCMLLAVAATTIPRQSGDAEMLAPGLISTGRDYGVTFSPDGNTMYFTRGREIHWTTRVGDSWARPRRAAFSDGAWIRRYTGGNADIEYFNWDPVISPDGSRLYIMSHGLVDGRIVAGEDGDMDLWVLDRVGAGYGDDAWGAPRHLGPPISMQGHNEGAIGVTKDGTAFFFSSRRPDSQGGSDIYSSRLENGVYRTAVNLGPHINTAAFDGHVFADPDGRFLLYISNNRPDGFGDCDIYVTWRTGNDWGPPVNLGPKVNTERCEITPSLSRDGETLFFGRIEDREKDIRNIYSIRLRDTGFADSGQSSFALAEYLMDEKQEIALARSAAPDRVSSQASIMVLRRTGYEKVVEGSNGFVCLLLRSWGNPTFDPASAFDPRIRIPECLDATASATILPIQLRRAELGVRGVPGVAIRDTVRHELEGGRLRRPETVAFGYMMSTTMRLTDGSHLEPHMMVYVPAYSNVTLGGHPWREGPFVEGGPNEPFTAVVIYVPRGVVTPGGPR